MAEYENRERSYAVTMGDTLGAFCRHVVEADNAAKGAYVQRIVDLAGLENLELKAEANLIGLDESLQTHISVPPAVIAPVQPIEIDDARLDMSMEVSAHTESTTSIKSESEAEGKGSVNLGPFGKIGVSIKANVSVGKERKRSSDYRATTEVHVSFKQGETPEGVSRILDSINGTVSKSLEVNERLIDARSQQLMGVVDEALDRGAEIAETEGE